MSLAIDALRCTGCKLCQIVCSVANFGENNPKKAAIRIVSKLFTEARYEVVVCDQCGECIDACPFEAISLVEGVVTIDPELCTNCGICVDACPKDAMFTHKEVDHPIKCILCGECAKLCPRGILGSLEAADEGKVAG
ncbi:MAG TPA: 4Fe-4S dicluster domain-containing protein [Bacillota bacterium]|jgi:Fe-S-cluster-containing hydrogenase component 2|nr:4Fe-4S dicluster domain-containing protein [Bacillota bacterium]HPZ91923.1 4Fe-4S dicluster domain-containing protein [Bacillota bacterium]